MKLKPFALIIINTLCILIHFMTICFIMPTLTPNAEFTRRLYSVHVACPQRAHGLGDPTALQQRAV